MARAKALRAGRPVDGELRGPASATLLDNLMFLAGFALPLALQGAFTRNRAWVSFFSLIQLDPVAVRSVGRMRRRGGDHFWIWLGTTRALLVLDPRSIAEVLDRSPVDFVAGEGKRGMLHFQPDAVTVSRGLEWVERRRFNEAVLATGVSPPPSAREILGVVRAEIQPPGVPRTQRLEWSDFDVAFRRIMLQVVFGPAARDDQDLADRLKQLLREANRPAPLRREPSKHLAPFYERIRAYLARPAEGSLAARCRQVPSTKRTRVDGQIPHWMFAMWETLAINTIRALALVVSHPAAELNVRRELRGRDLGDPEAIDGLGYLEGCIQEAMRLWPTTPILVREAAADTRLGGTRIDAGTQILILNAFHSRDGESYEAADRFDPEAWSRGSPHPLFQHFGGGRQVCAGRELALFIAKAALATLLDQGRRCRLLQPRLDHRRPLPYAYDPFRVRFIVGSAP